MSRLQAALSLIALFHPMARTGCKHRTLNILCYINYSNECASSLFRDTKRYCIQLSTCLGVLHSDKLTHAYTERLFRKVACSVCDVP